MVCTPATRRGPTACTPVSRCGAGEETP
uniref:Uncharacterized protein n=1 Tax=Arundo donax TaxID=35708 RepID=A0A0A8ZTJ2_ARUDO